MFGATEIADFAFIGGDLCQNPMAGTISVTQEGYAKTLDKEDLEGLELEGNE